MFLECLFESEVARLVASSIEVKQTVEANALHAGDECSCGRVRLQATAGADAHEGECAVLGFLCTCLEVDVGQGVHFVNDDVAVVTADARALHGDALAVVHACDGMEFTVAYLAFLRIKMRGHERDACWVSDEDDFVGELRRVEVQMKIEPSLLIINSDSGKNVFSMVVED